MNRLTALLGMPLPVIQAPMAGVQGSALALSVMRAGGLGSLPAATLSADALREELGVLQGSGLPYNVNFFCHLPPVPDARREAAWRASLAPFYAEYGIDPDRIPAGAGRNPFTLESALLLEEFRPPVVSFHFGLPAPDLLERVRSWGAKILSSATMVQEALWLQERGVHAIIAQGLEAGGHRGFFLTRDLGTQAGTLALLSQVVGAVDVPVVAAGGIADAQSAMAAFALGASGVQAGTAYLLCAEAATSDLHRTALRQEASPGTARGTALTTLFTGGAARGIVNRAMRELGALDNAAPPFPLAAAGIAPLRIAAEQSGFDDFSPLWCGQNVGVCGHADAAEITRALAAGTTGFTLAGRAEPLSS